MRLLSIFFGLVFQVLLIYATSSNTSTPTLSATSTPSSNPTPSSLPTTSVTSTSTSQTTSASTTATTSASPVSPTASLSQPTPTPTPSTPPLGCSGCPCRSTGTGCDVGQCVNFTCPVIPAPAPLPAPAPVAFGCAGCPCRTTPPYCDVGTCYGPPGNAFCESAPAPAPAPCYSNCTGRQCGGDGCGGSCAPGCNTTAGLVCQSGLCVNDTSVDVSFDAGCVIFEAPLIGRLDICLNIIFTGCDLDIQITLPAPFEPLLYHNDIRGLQLTNGSVIGSCDSGCGVCAEVYNFTAVGSQSDGCVQITGACGFSITPDLGNLTCWKNLTFTCDRCPGDCSGNGVCQNGDCLCDEGYYGVDCSGIYQPTSANQSSEVDNSARNGLIAGIVILAILLIVIVIVLVVCLRRSKKNSPSRYVSHGADPEPESQEMQTETDSSTLNEEQESSE